MGLGLRRRAGDGDREEAWDGEAGGGIGRPGAPRPAHLPALLRAGPPGRARCAGELLPLPVCGSSYRSAPSEPVPLSGAVLCGRVPVTSPTPHAGGPRTAPAEHLFLLPRGAGACPRPVAARARRLAPSLRVCRRGALGPAGPAGLRKPILRVSVPQDAAGLPNWNSLPLRSGLLCRGAAGLHSQRLRPDSLTSERGRPGSRRVRHFVSSDEAALLCTRFPSFLCRPLEKRAHVCLRFLSYPFLPVPCDSCVPAARGLNAPSCGGFWAPALRFPWGDFL